jgi:energy-coupling factor transporter ATP-binding protein EcfA2
MHTAGFHDIRIDGFRGIRGLTLDGCGPLNLLVGGNNSGKTSVLEALLLLTDPMDVDQWEAAVELRRTWPFVDYRFRTDGMDRLDALTWLFPHVAGEAGPLRLHATSSRSTTSVEASVERIVGTPPRQAVFDDTGLIEGGPYSMGVGRLREEPDPYPADGIVIDMTVAGPQAQINGFSGSPQPYRMVLWESGRASRRRVRRASGRAWPSAFATPISHRSDGYLTSRVGRLIRAKTKDEAVALLQMLDKKLRDLVLVTPEEPDESRGSLPRRGRAATLHVEHADAGLVPIHVLGDGTRRAIHFATLVTELGEGGLLLIDEIESGIHTAVLRGVFSWLARACRDRGVQMFATTHSLEAVDSLLEAVPDPEVVLYRFKNGEARRYEGDLLRIARFEMGQEVR